MSVLLRLALLAYPQPLRARYGGELAEIPTTPLALADIVVAGLLERLDNLVRELRHATRSLLRSPGGTAVAVLALALGVGANVAVFSVIRPILLEPLPFTNPDRLYVMRTKMRGLQPESFQTLALASHYLDWRDESTRFANVEAAATTNQTLQLDQRAELSRVAQTTPGLLAMLGVKPRLGRGFAPADATIDGPNVVLLSEAYWRSRFGASDDVLGRTLILEEEPWEVIGVAPAALNQFLEADLWQPLRIDEAGVRNGGPLRAIQVFGRLAPESSPQSALAELDAILDSKKNESYARAFLKDAWADMLPLEEHLVGNVKTTLQLLWGAVALVLLIACSNVAGILLVRSATRHTETGVRLALGAERRSLFRQALTEAVVLSLAGAAAGILLACVGVRALVANLPSSFPRADAIGVDGPVLALSLLVAVLIGLIVGIAPAFVALRRSPAEAMRTRASSATSGRGLSRVHGGLVAMQVALAAVLLTASGLLLHSLVRLGRVDIGVHSPQTATLALAYPRSFSTEQRNAYLRELLGRARSLPGAEEAAVSATVPLTGFAMGAAFALPEDPPLSEDEQRALNIPRQTFFNAVSEDYFRTVGARLLEGRTLEPADAAAGNVVINRALAETAFPGERAVGRRIGMRGGKRFFTIVGVIESYRQLTPRWPVSSEIYAHWLAEGANAAYRLSVKPAAGADADLIPALRQIATELNRAVVILDAQTQRGLLAAKTADDRLRATLLGLFAAIAVLLAGSGIFATVAFAVSRRTREIAIRRALGATAASVCATALRGALAACALGAATGLVAAYWLRSLTRDLLFEVAPFDPATYAAATLLLLALILAASLGPAARAVRQNPARNLRSS
ncbi:MAG: ABC transporter permease [Acidobacteria bacterium]|nr:ABC transporter permease [Acidobacteriota bacterium]